MIGAVAGAYYGVPEEILHKAETFLDAHLRASLRSWRLKPNQQLLTPQQCAEMV